MSTCSSCAKKKQTARLHLFFPPPLFVDLLLKYWLSRSLQDLQTFTVIYGACNKKRSDTNMLVQGVMQRCISCPWQLSVGLVCLCRTRPSLQWTPLWQRLALYISKALAPQWKGTRVQTRKFDCFDLILNKGKKF